MQNDLKKIQKKYKNELVPAALGLAIFIIIFKIVMPQLSQISDLQSQIRDKTSSVKTLQTTVSLLQSLQPAELDTNYDLVLKALPVQKDFVLIFTQLDKIAQKTNVKLGGFSLKIGEVYNTKKAGGPTSGSGAAGLPYLELVIGANGTSDELKNFVAQLYSSVPVVDVTKIDMNTTTGSFTTDFFFKGIATEVNKNAKVQPFTADETKLLKTLKTWGGD